MGICLTFPFLFFFLGGDILNHEDAAFVFLQFRRVEGSELMASVLSLLSSCQSYRHVRHQHLPLGGFCRRRSVWLAKAGTTSEVGYAPPG